MSVVVLIVRSLLAGLGAFTLFDYALLVADRRMNRATRVVIAGFLGVLLITGMLLEDLGA